MERRLPISQCDLRVFRVICNDFGVGLGVSNSGGSRRVPARVLPSRIFLRDYRAVQQYGNIIHRDRSKRGGTRGDVVQVGLGEKKREKKKK